MNGLVGLPPASRKLHSLGVYRSANGLNGRHRFIDPQERGQQDSKVEEMLLVLACTFCFEVFVLVIGGLLGASRIA